MKQKVIHGVFLAIRQLVARSARRLRQFNVNTSTDVFTDADAVRGC